MKVTACCQVCPATGGSHFSGSGDNPLPLPAGSRQDITPIDPDLQMVKMKDVTPDWRAEDFHPPSSTLSCSQRRSRLMGQTAFLSIPLLQMKVSRGLETIDPGPTNHYTTRAFG
jgi:hypothetical protein